MICKLCKKKTIDTDIYCLTCGKATDSYKEQFRIKKTLQEAKVSAKSEGNNLIFYYIPIAVVLIALAYISSHDILTDSHWINYILFNVSAILIVPLLILPFCLVIREREDISGLKQAFAYYPKLLLFVALIALYFFALKIICQGDPILNLVRLILVLWGIAIAFPVPFLIFTRNECVFKSIRRGYIAGKYLRWHQFGLSLILGVLLLASVLLLLIPLPVTMNFAGHLMYVWHKKQGEFQLHDKPKDY